MASLRKRSRSHAPGSTAPQDPLHLLALGRAASAQNELSLAARAYGSLIDLGATRVELRRAAGHALESLGDYALPLAIDSYRKALALRPDHPGGLRLLAMAQWRAGQRDAANATLQRGQRGWAWGRFPGVPELFADEVERTRGSAGRELLRACVYWESDASDVDLHVYDGEHRYAGNGVHEIRGPRLSGDAERGFGPECVSAGGADLAFPYQLQVQHAARNAMGYALGAVHVLRVDAAGRASFEMRPFVLMKDQAYLELGAISGS
ncbi:MAG TPA: hypothetical protein VFZ61_21165 [Polyangiales bacterium]